MFHAILSLALLQSADPSVLARIEPRMQAHVDKGHIHGTVTLLMEKGQLVHSAVTGWADRENNKPMRKDSIFQIMSMTKPFTGVGIMMMVEEGKLNLHDPVAKYLPEFRDKPNILVRQLMTHTSGMASNPIGANIEWYYSMKVSLEDAVKFYATVPLIYDPGTKWVYSNMGIATLGRLIEVTSGLKYEDFIHQRILAPLGMKDSFFFPPEDKKSRIVVNYCTKDGKLSPCPHSTLGGDSRNLRAGATYPAPEFGLYSTAADLAEFYQMMLAGGSWKGKRFLSKASVAAMTMVQTGDIKAGHNAGTAFGLTWEVAKDPAAAAMLWSIGTFGHGGAFGTHGWIDPAKQLVGVFLVQGGSGNAEAKANFIAMASAAAN
ncbi:MAG: serine hydrolase domain-containing protein [Acidobacteriota bacterium]